MDKPSIYLKKSELPNGANILDTSKSALGELFFIRNPHVPKGNVESNPDYKEFENTHIDDFVYAFYPWRNTAVLIPNDDIYLELRTARNRNVILAKEQLAFRNFRVGVAGLSVGSAILSALAMSGGPKRMKIADFDIIEITNLNRLRANLLDVGSNKVEIAARNIWELDPFAELELFESGVNEKNLEKFISSPKLDVFVDEMDSLDMKVLGREIAKRTGTPVLMATDNGDGIILDVERYDLEPTRDIFHGLLNDEDTTNLKDLPRDKWMRIATKIVDPKLLRPRMQQSLPEIGKTLGGIPQLGASATMAGSAMAFAIRKISNGDTLNSGRYVLNLDTMIDEH